MLWKTQAALWLSLVLMCGAMLGMVLAARWRRHGDGHRRQQAATDAMSVLAAVELYLANDPSASCPTMGELVAERILSGSTRIEDPWGHLFIIRCLPNALEVTSFGPDGQPSYDDIKERRTLPPDARSAPTHAASSGGSRLHGPD